MEVPELAEAFAALGNALRLKIVRALLEAEPAGQTLAESVIATGRPASTVVFHLRLLCQAKIVKATPLDNRVICYHADGARIAALAKYLGHSPRTMPLTPSLDSDAQIFKSSTASDAHSWLAQHIDKAMDGESLALPNPLPLADSAAELMKLSALRAELEAAGYEFGIAAGIHALIDGMEVKAAAEHAHVRWSRLHRTFVRDGWAAKVKAAMTE